jgi:hypothetical protein
MKKTFFSGNMRKVYALGIFLICGLLLISADDCESMYLEELQISQASGTAQQSNQDGTNPSGGAGSPAAGVPGAGALLENDLGAESTGASYLRTIIGKEWKLVELRLSSKTVILDRNKLNTEGVGDFFTMAVNASRISGKAAPNRYVTAYEAGPDNSLTLLPVITTLMATGFDPERLHEQEYYQYLGRVKSWKLNQQTLELYTTDANEKDAVLAYSN